MGFNKKKRTTEKVLKEATKCNKEKDKEKKGATLG